MKTEVWAHRGASGYAPENTIEAFQIAEQLHADGVELDVQLTKDGELVVIHDETVDRVSDAVGYVKDYTLAELRKINVSNSMSDYQNVRIPTLQEVLEELRPSGMKINIECKNGIFCYSALEEKVVQLVKDMKMTDRIWCSSFRHESVLKVKQLCPEIRTGFLIADVMLEPAAYCRRWGVDALHPALYHMQDESLADKCRENGVAVHVWTVNEEKDMKKLCQSGVEAIITNFPDRARNVVDNV